MPKLGNHSKRYAEVKAAIDKFWVDNHFPPTIRDLQQMTGISSTSTVAYYLKRLPEIRMARWGRIIPSWVDDVLTSRQSQEQ
jgi:hypothetical protein